jgi:uncharacterized repeat protein (TIGR03847 family)
MSIDLGLVELLGAESIGQPGQRRFRLFVQTARGAALIWMEKEQLNNLSLALDRFLAQVTEGQVLRIEAQAGDRPLGEGMPAWFPQGSAHEFQIGQMKINYDERTTQFLLSAIPLEILMDREREPQVIIDEDHAVSFLFNQRQAQRLSSNITQVVTSGRPVCPLCRQPLDGGPHACIQQNGHTEIVQVLGSGIIEDDDDDEE